MTPLREEGKEKGEKLLFYQMPQQTGERKKTSRGTSIKWKTKGPDCTFADLTRPEKGRRKKKKKRTISASGQRERKKEVYPTTKDKKIPESDRLPISIPEGERRVRPYHQLPARSKKGKGRAEPWG